MGGSQSSENENKNIKSIRTQDQLHAHSSEVFLISCMDFRLLDDIVRAMDGLGYNNNYDQIIVAGSSLGVCQNHFPHWGQTVMDHMEIGLKLHDFRKIIVIDHIDCGAFKKFHPELLEKKDPEFEHKLHEEYLQQVHDKLKLKFPKFEFQAFLMDLKGDIEEIKVDTQKVAYDENAADKETTEFLSEIK